MALDIDAIAKQYPTLSQEGAEDIKAVNESLASLFTEAGGTLASRDPYILTLPQDSQFAYKHRNEYSATEWAHRMPFHRNEGEGIQYQTYRYYEPGTSLFQQYPSSSTTQTSTPLKQTPNVGPKKVMSLSAYKKQKKGSSSPAQNKGQSALKPVEEERKDTETADILASMDDDVVVDLDEPHSSSKELKRGRENEPDVHERSPKRQQLSITAEHPPLSSHADAPVTNEIDFPTKADSARDVPAKVSPIEEFIKSLPNRLSPTLPGNMESALTHRKGSKSRKSDSLASKKHASEAPHDPSRAEGSQSARPVTLINGAHQTTPTSDSKRKRVDDESHVSTAKRPRENGDMPSSAEKSQKLASSPPDSPSMRRSTILKPSKALSAVNNAQHASMSPSVGTPSMDQRAAITTKTAAQQAWEAEQKRFETLGREFKHSATAVADSNPRLAAVRALASLMCYMLAYTCTDQTSLCAQPKQAPVTKSWRSVIPFLKFVELHTKAFPPLVGVTGLLSLALTTHVLSLLEATPASQLPSSASIVEITTIMRSAAGKAKTNLDADTFAKKFPKAWKSRDPYDRGEDLLVIGELLLKSHHFPTTIMTTPVQAVRTGLAILWEWMAQEQVVERIELEEVNYSTKS